MKHSMLLMSRPPGLRPPLSDVRRSRFASSLICLGAVRGVASPSLFRDSRFFAARFSSRMSSAAGSSESKSSSSSSSDSASPSDPSAFSNVGFCFLLVWSHTSTCVQRTSAFFTPPPYWRLIGCASSSSSSSLSSASSSANPARRTSSASPRFPSKGSV